MEIEGLLREMRTLESIANQPTTLSYFAQTALTREDLARGCRCILNWLLGYTGSASIAPLKLNPKYLKDIACQKLLDENPALQEVFQVKDNHLHFAERLDDETRQKIIQIAKQNDNPVVLIDPIIPDEFYHELYPDAKPREKPNPS